MLDVYQTLVHIVEQDTLVRAAAVLHVTQPTITRQLQQLESELGMPLFDRIGKRLVLNHAGQRVYRYAKMYIGLKQKMQEELNSFRNPESGQVCLGAGLTPSIYLLPQILAAYREVHPRVQFQIRTGSSTEILNLLVQREIDLGVVTTFHPEGDDLRGTPLLRDDLLLVASPASSLGVRERVSIADLDGYPFVLMRQGSGLRKMVTELAAAAGIEIAIAMETDSLESINRLVQNGVGASFLPRSSAQDDILEGRLAEVRVSDVSLGARTITLVSRADSLLPACAAQFAGEVGGLVSRLHRPQAGV